MGRPPPVRVGTSRIPTQPGGVCQLEIGYGERAGHQLRGRLQRQRVAGKQVSILENRIDQQSRSRGIHSGTLDAAHPACRGIGSRHHFEYETLEHELRVETEPRAAAGHLPERHGPIRKRRPDREQNHLIRHAQERAFRDAQCERAGAEEHVVAQAPRLQRRDLLGRERQLGACGRLSRREDR